MNTRQTLLEYFRVGKESWDQYVYNFDHDVELATSKLGRKVPSVVPERILELFDAIRKNIDIKKMRLAAGYLSKGNPPDATYHMLDAGVAGTIVVTFSGVESHIARFCTRLPELLDATFRDSPYRIHNLRGCLISTLLDDAQFGWVSTIISECGERSDTSTADDITVSSADLLPPPSISHNVTTSSKLSYRAVVAPFTPTPLPSRVSLPGKQAHDMQAMLAQLLNTFWVAHQMIECALTVDSHGTTRLIIDFAVCDKSHAPSQTTYDMLCPCEYGFTLTSCKTMDKTPAQVRLEFQR